MSTDDIEESAQICNAAIQVNTNDLIVKACSPFDELHLRKSN